MDLLARPKFPWENFNLVNAISSSLSEGFKRKRFAFLESPLRFFLLERCNMIFRLLLGIFGTPQPRHRIENIMVQSTHSEQYCICNINKRIKTLT